MLNKVNYIQGPTLFQCDIENKQHSSISSVWLMKTTDAGDSREPGKQNKKKVVANSRGQVATPDLLQSISEKVIERLLYQAFT